MAFKDAGQVTLVGEAALSCDLDEGDSGLFEELLCFLDAQA